MDRKLRSEAYIKIYAEGSYGKGWREVEMEEVPQKALLQMMN